MPGLKNKNPLGLTELAPFIEFLKKMVKFHPKRDQKLVNSTQLGAELTPKDLLKLELLLFMSFVMAVHGSEENITFAKKFYPKRFPLLVSLLLGTLTFKHFSDDFKYDVLKFFHANFDIDEELLNKILPGLKTVNDSTPYVPFSHFLFERNENLPNYFYKGESGNPEARGFDKKEFFTRPQGGARQDTSEESSGQDFAKASQPSVLSPYEILDMKPKFEEESEKEFSDRLRKQYYKAALRCHPDKGGSKEKFQELDKAYKDLLNNPDYSAENETAKQNYPSRNRRPG